MTADSGGYVLVDLGPSLWIWAAAIAVLLALVGLGISLLIRRGRSDSPMGPGRR
jgi:hypothetical protein